MRVIPRLLAGSGTLARDVAWGSSALILPHSVGNPRRLRGRPVEGASASPGRTPRVLWSLLGEGLGHPPSPSSC